MFYSSNCCIETEGLLKVTDSQAVIYNSKSGIISKMVQDRDVVTTDR